MNSRQCSSAALQPNLLAEMCHRGKFSKVRGVLLMKREQLPWRRFMLYLCCSSVIPNETCAVRGLLPTFRTHYMSDLQHENQRLRLSLPDSSSMLSVVTGASGAYMASTSFAKLVPSSDTVKAVTFCPKSAIMFLWMNNCFQSGSPVRLLPSLSSLASQPMLAMSKAANLQPWRRCRGVTCRHC